MEFTATLVRERLGQNTELALLRAAGAHVVFEYDGNAVWLQLGARRLSEIEWADWWDPRVVSREEHAAWIAHQLIVGIWSRQRKNGAESS